MKIVLVSDSHGNNKALDEIALIHPDADLYLHAGDSEAHEYSIAPFESVRGNCDYFSNAPERRIIDTPCGKLLMQHRPIIPYDLINQYNIKIFVHGHTHMRKCVEQNGLLIINPGAISFARDNNDLSYAVIKIDKKIEVEFLDLLEKSSPK